MAKSSTDKTNKNTFRARENIAEYQWQFRDAENGRARVVGLADITREELQEALAISMDTLELASQKISEVDEIFERWCDGRPIESPYHDCLDED